MALPSIYIKGCLPFCDHQYLSTFTTVSNNIDYEFGLVKRNGKKIQRRVILVFFQVITTSTIEMDAFLGKFKLASQDNFDAYLKALGMTIESHSIAFISHINSFTNPSWQCSEV